MWLATVYQPAAFGRLCVETSSSSSKDVEPPPAAFGRLCVETSVTILLPVLKSQPPSGGCVLKHSIEFKRGRGSGPAAFGRLCVETLQYLRMQNGWQQVPTLRKPALCVSHFMCGGCTYPCGFRLPSDAKRVGSECPPDGTGFGSLIPNLRYLFLLCEQVVQSLRHGGMGEYLVAHITGGDFVVYRHFE